MKIITLKKTRFLLLSAAFILSVSASYAQKSIYDVVPGSGPKKTSTGKTNETTLPDIINGNDKNHHETKTVYHRKRRNLPPGQAKKVYGGRATDYAPGQVKKHHHGHKNKNHHGHKGKNKHD